LIMAFCCPFNRLVRMPVTQIFLHSPLGLVPIYPLPHHTNAPFKETVDNIISTLSDKIALCPISNTQVIAINEDKVEIWGQ
ncbi:Type 1 glutamine amidotransferase-like domain-containing protein, partial [Aeromonas enteropelogenes]|uniref:Type 1 glutamine amidotransferase-like domain-containing protein n=2 Tax=Aeromonas TaxID=642 RepID=UPI003BA2941F